MLGKQHFLFFPTMFFIVSKTEVICWTFNFLSSNVISLCCFKILWYGKALIFCAFQESMSFQGGRLIQHIPHIHKWLRHLISLPRIQEASILCGYDIKLLRSCLNDRRKDTENMMFTIPDRVLDLAEENSDIS